MPLYTLAGLTVAMQPKSPLVEQRCRRYLTETIDKPDMTLTGEGNDDGEYARLAGSFYKQLLRFDGFLLHASAVDYDGKAYAFSAPSGTGKSTHAALWKTQFGATVINDDKPAVRLVNGVFCACGTPFSGKTNQSENRCVPLGGIAFLQRASENHIERLDMKEALWSLLNQTLRPQQAAEVEQLLALLERLLRQVPVYRLYCTPTIDAAQLAKEVMTASEEKNESI